MRKIFLTLLCLMMCLVSFADNDIRHVSATYDYVSNDPNESRESALRTAFERAKIKALQDKFGLDVIGINSMLQTNASVGADASSSLNVFSVQENVVRGEWIGEVKEKIVKPYSCDGGFCHVTVYVEGEARCKDAQDIDIHYAFVNNAHDRQNRDQYYDGDDVFLRFSSPVAGSLCVYLVDEEQNAYCLLPYMSEQSGCQHVKANTEYVFFSAQDDIKADEYTLNCQNSIEQNALFVIFTPNTLTKARDRQSGKNWRDEQMPRQLPYKDFITWLANNQKRDKNMVVRKEIVTIRK